MLNLLELPARFARSTLANPAQWLIDALTGANSTSEVSALNTSAVWNAVTLITGSLLSVPLVIYEREDAHTKRRATDHPLYPLLHDAPNSEMTSQVWRRLVFFHVLLWGNSYNIIERDPHTFRPVALWPVTPERVRLIRAPDSTLWYEVRSETLGTTMVPSEDVLHLHGLGYDGLTGYSVITMARRSLATVQASERFGETFYANAARPSGVLEHPASLTEDAAQKLIRSWNANYSGADNVGKTIVLEEGMKWAQVTIPPEDAQYLETRRFSIEEIARWFNVPPHKLKDLTRATFSNIEHQGIEYVVDTLTPWAKLLEAEITRRLLLPTERARYSPSFVFQALMRGDSKARADYYATMNRVGAFSINRILELEDENTIGAPGDLHYVQENMTPAEQVYQTYTSGGVADDDRAAAIAAVWCDALTRCAKREAQRIRQGAPRDSVRGLRDWCDTFYAGFASEMTATLAPAAMLAGHSAERVALTWCAESRAALDECDAVAGFMPMVIEWPKSRPRQFIRALATGDATETALQETTDAADDE